MRVGVILREAIVAFSLWVLEDVLHTLGAKIKAHKLGILALSALIPRTNDGIHTTEIAPDAEMRESFVIKDQSTRAADVNARRSGDGFILCVDVVNVAFHIRL